MDKELKLGIMTNKELSEWFGVKEATFKSTKNKKLAALKEYAEFEEVKGKVNILFIRKPIFVKGANYIKVREIVIDPWEFNTPSTVKRQIEKYGLVAEKETNLKLTTIAAYAYSNKIELYGKTGDRIGGSKGYSHFETVKVIDDEMYRLSPQEVEEKNKFFKEYFYNKKITVEEKAQEIEDKYGSKEISRTEYLNLINENHNTTITAYTEALIALGVKWGCTLSRAVVITEKEVAAW